MATLTGYTPQQMVADLAKKWSGADDLLGAYVGIINSVLGNGRYKARSTSDTDDSIVEIVAVHPINYQLGDRVVLLPVLGGETYIIGFDNGGGAFDLKNFTVEGEAPVSTDVWSPVSNRSQHWLANSGLTTMSSVGMAAPSVTGSASTFDNGSGAHVRYDSSGAINSFAGLNSSFALVRTDWNPKLLIRLTTGTSVANIRMWIGLFSSDPRASSAPNLHIAAFRFATDVDTGFWRAVTGDGAARTANYGSNRVIGSSDQTELYLDLDATRAIFYVNGVELDTITSNLPAAGQKMGIVVAATALEAAIKMMRINRVSLAHK